MEFYYHSVDKDVLVLSADGVLDSHNAEEFVNELGGLVEGGAGKLIVDCSRLGYISSYGIAILMRLHKKLARRGCEARRSRHHGRPLDSGDRAGPSLSDLSESRRGPSRLRHVTDPVRG